MKKIYTNNITYKDIGKIIILNGWINSYKILKNCIFIDLRDREGIIQVVIENNNNTLFNFAKKLRQEYCIQVKGIINRRNKLLLEIKAKKIILINSSINLPFNIHIVNKENIRLKYRYLDLRSTYMTNIIKIKSKILCFIRNYFYKNNFLEIETPILSNPNPEGARDFIVPSRIHKNKFYALPQSPQLYKQLLMISGLDCYFQIAKCFRDEDLRSYRQPEFTQLDIEMSFIKSKEIRKFIELFIKKIWHKFKKRKLSNFKIITYKKALEKYGTDKPDLRNPLFFIKINLLFVNYNNIKYDYIAINIKNGLNLLNKKYLNEYKKLFNLYNIKIFGWIKIINIKSNNWIISSSLRSILDFNKTQKIIDFIECKNKDLIFISIDKMTKLLNILNLFRKKLGTNLNLINNNIDIPLWVINFPLFKKTIEGTLTSNHNPFTAPLNKYTKKDLFNNTDKILADDYDLIINGYELGGGSVRNYSKKIQSSIFYILGLNKLQQKKQFGFLLKALQYGAPYHAGIALGIERLLMLILDLDNIRDIIAFPKTTNFTCLLTNSPMILDK